jgi:mRNA interferase HicA
VKRRALLQHLKKYGCELYREGANHSIYWNPENGEVSPVPRHTEIDNNLARDICKDLKIPRPGAS